MAENNQNFSGEALENAVSADVSLEQDSEIDTQTDLSSISIEEEEVQNEVSTDSNEVAEKEVVNEDLENLEFSDGGAQINESVFLDSGETPQVSSTKEETEHFSKYLRWFFISSIVTILGIIAIALLFSFQTYITKASQNTVSGDDVKFVEQYKDKLSKVRGYLGKDNKQNYVAPAIPADNALDKVNQIINAKDIDYIDKKDILSKYVSDLVRNSQDGATKIDTIKQEIAKQGFLPEELGGLLSDDEAIDTIQRSLNALEVIKFSTATKVFSYMNTALATISQMVRTSGASVDAIRQLLVLLNSRGEKDIASYVYMCYLNPFETNANCDTIGDLDLYYNSIIKDNSINMSLFKNTMNAINQLLEKEDTAMFSITFNGFNAQDKNITFNIEVYTNQTDERALLAQGKKNPNIFILTNIINLLKQSSFIIGAEINTKEVNVETRTLSLGGLTSIVNYSSKDFTVPIQKDTEREIFDYIDLDGIDKLISKRSNDNVEEDSDAEINVDTEEKTLLEDTSDYYVSDEYAVDYEEDYTFVSDGEEVDIDQLEEYVGYNSYSEDAAEQYEEDY